MVIETYPERGWNYRMTDMQATLGLCQLELLDEILAERTRLAARYTAAIEQIPFLEPPFEPELRGAHVAVVRGRRWRPTCRSIAPS